MLRHARVHGSPLSAHVMTWQVSTKLVDRFVASEFGRIDTDDSGGICLSEFTTYAHA